MGRKVDDLVGFVDFAPTILEVSETNSEKILSIIGRIFLNILEAKEECLIGACRKYSFTGTKRHSSSRHKNMGYPQREIFSNDYALIWNMEPNHWPVGAPQKYNPQDTTALLPKYGLDKTGNYIPHAAFTDIDDCPTKTFIIENFKNDSISRYFELAHGKRPEFELYDIVKDPSCLTNLFDNPKYQKAQEQLMAVLKEELTETKDPRMAGPDKAVFDSYKRYSRICKFPE